MNEHKCPGCDRHYLGKPMTWRGIEVCMSCFAKAWRNQAKVTVVSIEAYRQAIRHPWATEMVLEAKSLRHNGVPEADL